jgi:hypothetical protein
MAERGHIIPAATWWLLLARELVTKDARDLTSLGEDLAKHADRKEPFSYSQLSRFTRGEIGTTLELADALCAEYTRLPPPAFFPRTYREAVLIQGLTEQLERSGEIPSEKDTPATVVELPKKKRAPKRKRGTAQQPPLKVGLEIGPQVGIGPKRRSHG